MSGSLLAVALLATICLVRPAQGHMNGAPNAPAVPSGPSNGYEGAFYTYSTSAQDPDGDKVYYLFDFGYFNSGWYSPVVNSGQTASVSNKWDTVGTYPVKAKALEVHDFHDDQPPSQASAFSVPGSVTVLRPDGCAALRTNKRQYGLREMVEITFENQCGELVLLRSDPAWRVWWWLSTGDSGCTSGFKRQRQVFPPAALQVIVEVPSGAKRTWTWDQTDNTGQGVEEGCYTVQIEGAFTGSERVLGDYAATFYTAGGRRSLPGGDVDCNGDVDATDALKMLRKVARLSVSQTAPCPEIGSLVDSAYFGDVDCDGNMDVTDALKVLRLIANLPVNRTGLCRDTGS